MSGMARWTRTHETDFELPVATAQLRGHTIADYVDAIADRYPERLYGAFVDVTGNVSDTLTYASLVGRSRRLAAWLTRDLGLARGERVILAYPPGLEMVAAFVACSRAGLIAVPLPAITTRTSGKIVLRHERVISDCRAAAVLTSSACTGGESRIALWRSRAAARWPHVIAYASDHAGDFGTEFCERRPHPIALLQYTSGSTGVPKGVVVPHSHIIHSARGTLDHVPVCATWLPQFHDMGLIGSYLFPAVLGGTVYGLSAADFLRRPSVWLRTISDVRATCTSAPNFAYEYCLSSGRIDDADLTGIDLSSLRIVMSAAEPVQLAVQRAFFDRFARYGLSPTAQCAAYGLAENTLTVTHGGRGGVRTSRALLGSAASIASGGGTPTESRSLLDSKQGLADSEDDAVEVASCGRPIPGVVVRIVRPDGQRVLGDGLVGEIWVAGECVCPGYWNDGLEPDPSFRAYLPSPAGDPRPYLRTGDLGFTVEGELYVCGRLKDVLVVRGANYHPHDLEEALAGRCEGVRRGSVAVIPLANHEGGYVVAVEVSRAQPHPNAWEVARVASVVCGEAPRRVMFVAKSTIARTTSGKISRAGTRDRLLAANAPVISSFCPDDLAEEHGETPLARVVSLLSRCCPADRPDATLGELGIDSLTLVTLSLEIEAARHDDSCVDPAPRVDVSMLQRMTRADVVRLMDVVTRSQSAPAAAWVRDQYALRVGEARRADRSAMLADLRLDPGIRARRTVTACDQGVVLTGATGFLGPFLLASLLERTASRCFVVARPAGGTSARERVVRALRESDLWTPELAEAFSHRVQIYSGDVSLPRLGLSCSDWRELTTRAQSVLHNAAAVNYVASYDMLRQHNVVGTREVLRLATVGQAKRVHLVSSTTIFGWTSLPEARESDENVEMRDLDFGYAQSKWVAERLVRSAAERGVAAHVYRPAFICASASGVGSASDIVVRLLAFMMKYGVAIDAPNQLSLLPVDLTARSIVALAEMAHRAPAVAHITADRYFTMTDVTVELTRQTGREFAYVDIPSFTRALRQYATIQDPVFPLVDFFTTASHKIVAMAEKRYCNRAYQSARRTCGVDVSQPELSSIVSGILRHMSRIGLIARSSPA